MFDFLIDIVPREEILFKINRKQGSAGGNNPKVVCLHTCICMQYAWMYHISGYIDVELNLVVGKINHVSPNFILPTFNTCTY